jgi:hypothetical protein
MLGPMTTSLLLPGFAILAAGCLAVSAQEARTWTDIKGRTIEGSFLKQDEATVWVKRGDGREVAIPKKSLSEDDLKHLESAVPAPAPAPAPGGAAAASTGRFNNAKIDPSAWKPKAGGFQLGSFSFATNLETEHFVIASNEKVRPATLAAYADACERLWSDMAADLPELAEAFKDKRMVVVLAEERGATAFSAWHDKHADESSSVGRHYQLSKAGIASFSLDKKFADEASLTIAGRLFRLDSKNAEHNRKTWPQRIHFVSGDIISQLVGRPDDNEDYNLSLVKLAFSYHREELICGRIESEVSFGGGGDVEGFKNGRNWPGATKKLLKGGARPDIKGFLEVHASKAEPRDLGFGLGLMRFIQMDATRLTNFGKMLEKARTDDKCPDPPAFSKALGFDSAEELNVAWRDFMLSDAFQ